MARKRKAQAFAAKWVEATNWIARLDAEAPSLPAANSWLYYPFFMFERYRHLRPRPTKDFRRQQHLLAGEESFREQVGEWERRLASEVPDALQGLERRQRRQLAALALHTTVKMQEFQRSKAKHARYMKLRKEAPRRRRVLRAKVSQTRAAVRTLLEYSHELDPLLGAERFTRAADEALKKLESAGNPSDFVPDFAGLIESGKSDSSLKYYVWPTSPINQCTFLLYGFFRHECSLTGDESEVQVGKLRNAFWSKHGVPRVIVREKYSDAESRGCNSVHRSVSRVIKAGVQPPKKLSKPS